MKVTLTESQLRTCLAKVLDAKAKSIAITAFSVQTRDVGYTQAVAQPNGNLDIEISINVSFSKERPR